jgi:hypothetical protein
MERGFGFDFGLRGHFIFEQQTDCSTVTHARPVFYR